MKNLHADARKALHAYVADTLKECSFDLNYRIDIELVGIELLEKQLRILRSVMDGFDFVTVYDLYFSLIHKVCSKTKSIEERSNLKGRIVEVLTQSQIEEIISKIQETYDAIPIQYTAFLHLPSVTLETGFHVEMIKKVTLLNMSEEEVSLYGKITGNTESFRLFSFSTPSIKEGQSYLKLDMQGYAADVPSCPLALDVRNIIRELFTALDVYEFIESPLPTSNIPAYGCLNAKLYVFRSDKKDQEPIVITLPFEIEYFVSKVKLNQAIFNKPSLSFLFKDESGKERKPIEINLEPIKNFFNLSSKDVEHIRASLEWFGFSLMTDNDTFSFIQATTALEALLGDSDEKEGVTNRLANRLAFLLMNKKTTRDQLIKKFKNIYAVRSSIIHGKERRLNENQKENKRELMKIVRMAIKKEINNHIY